jgi:serine/threonine protein kinase
MDEFHSDLKIIGEYKLLSSIGTGKLGEVYLAENINDIFSAEKYALKLFPPNLSKNRSFQSALEHLSLLLNGFDNPDILKAKYFKDAESGLCYLIMDYITGPGGKPDSLEHRLMSKKSFTEEDVYNITISLCGVLFFVHSFRGMGLLHGNLKSSNILFDAEGKIYLVDFALSMPLNPIVFDSEYMSPEEKKGARKSIKSEIYSLGIIIRKMIEKLPKNEVYSDKWDYILSSCLDKVPEERFDSTKDIVDLLVGKVEIERPQSKITVSTKKHTYFIGLALSFLFLIILSVYGIFYMQHAKNNPIEGENYQVFSPESFKIRPGYIPSAGSDDYYLDRILLKLDAAQNKKFVSALLLHTGFNPNGLNWVFFINETSKEKRTAAIKEWFLKYDNYRDLKSVQEYLDFIEDIVDETESVLNKQYIADLLAYPYDDSHELNWKFFTRDISQDEKDLAMRERFLEHFNNILISIRYYSFISHIVDTTEGAISKTFVSNLFLYPYYKITEPNWMFYLYDKSDANKDLIVKNWYEQSYYNVNSYDNYLNLVNSIAEAADNSLNKEKISDLFLSINFDTENLDWVYYMNENSVENKDKTLSASYIKNYPKIHNLILLDINHIPIVVKEINKLGSNKKNWTIQTSITDSDGKIITEFFKIGDRVILDGIPYKIIDIADKVTEVLDPSVGAMFEIDKSEVILTNPYGEKFTVIPDVPVFLYKPVAVVKNLTNNKTLRLNKNDTLEFGDANSEINTYKLIKLDSENNTVTFSRNGEEYIFHKSYDNKQ